MIFITFPGSFNHPGHFNLNPSAISAILAIQHIHLLRDIFFEDQYPPHYRSSAESISQSYSQVHSSRFAAGRSVRKTGVTAMVTEHHTNFHAFG